MSSGPTSVVIPEHIAELCSVDPAAKIDVVLESNHSFICRVGSLELRFVRLVEGEWEFDEIVGNCFVHVEMMSESSYWIGFDLEDGGRVCVDIGARRAPVRMTGWTEA